jgi:hypothetical protein
MINMMYANRILKIAELIVSLEIFFITPHPISVHDKYVCIVDITFIYSVYDYDSDAYDCLVSGNVCSVEFSVLEISVSLALKI